MADTATFGSRLKFLRIKLKLSQRDFAEKIGITASALSSYEKGQKNPSVNVAIAIANQFHVSLDWLCGISDKDTSSFNPVQEVNDALSALIYLFELRNGELFSTRQLNIDSPDSNAFGLLEIKSQVLWDFLKNIVSIYTLFDEESIDIVAYESCIRAITEKSSEDFVQETEANRDQAAEQLFRQLAHQAQKEAYNQKKGSS